jgi:hypothetical protein
MKSTNASLAAVLMAAAGAAQSGLPWDTKEIEPGVYRVTKTDRTQTEGKIPYLRAEALKEAERVAGAQGKVVVPIAEKEFPVNRPVSSASFEFTFRLADK